VRKDIAVEHAEPLDLPTIEPRGAVSADLLVEGRRIRVLGMHLDLSGLLRREQIRAILRHCRGCESACPTVLMGDFNQWGRTTGAFREFAAGWHVPAIGNSFPSRRPIAPLDRIVHSPEWHCSHTAVHHSALAVVASDHLPVRVTLELGA
jgi:endonuclease/exonuclease/phosphatase family metal-dependent hydrolase